MLKEKLEIARKLRSSSKRFGKRHINYKPLFKKCYITYVKQCIFKEKDCFQLIFKGKNKQVLNEHRLIYFLKKNGFKISAKNINDAKKSIIYTISRI